MSNVAAKPSSENSSMENNFAEKCGEECTEQREDFQQLLDDVGESVVHYCQRRPGVAALTVFAVGFFVGWKMKPW